jgi:RISC-loading complex subunit TARBP2
VIADDGIPGNPVGNLQELCISHRWAPPSYVLEGENGLPHEREFVITCVVENHQEIGVGKSKKLAKRQAAYRMQMKLKDTPIELPNQGGLEDEDEVMPLRFIIAGEMCVAIEAFALSNRLRKGLHLGVAA